MAWYEAGGVAVRVERRCPALDGAVGVQGAVMVTACNPYGRLKAAGWNARMMRRLGEKVRRHRVSLAASGTGKWREAQMLVACGRAVGEGLARRFGQNAILVLRRGQPARLLILAV